MARNACAALAVAENPGLVYAAILVVLAFARVISSFFLKKQEQMKIGMGNQSHPSLLRERCLMRSDCAGSPFYAFPLQDEAYVGV